VFDFFLIHNSSIAGIFCAEVLLIAVSFFVRQKKRGVFVLSILLALLLSGLLLASGSRAGWFGCAIGLVYIGDCHILIKQRKIALITTAGVILLFFLFLVFYKPDSSLGRKHIYELSVEILRGNWVAGIGLGKFKAHFNEYQANYFSQHDIDSKRALLADNTFYAFNDYLQWVIETGLSGLLFLVLLLYLTFKRISYLKREHGNKPTLVSATASLLCIAVAAMFSYPLQVIPIQTMVLVCFGIIAFYPVSNPVVSVKQKFASSSYKILILLITFAFISKVWNEFNSKKMEKEAFQLAMSGYKTAAINKYKKIVEKYPRPGYNWFLYAQQLYYANQLPAAYKSLKKGMLYYVDNKVYKLKADIEQELKMYPEAEKSYLRTIYMAPNRMGSRFDLLNFYVARNDTTKAVYWAKSILNMPVKVPSIRVDNILRETKSILEKLER
jgi:O-Antigen ligase